MHQHCYAISLYGIQCQNHIKLIFAKINTSLKYLLITTPKFHKFFCNGNVITKISTIYENLVHGAMRYPSNVPTSKLVSLLHMLFFKI